MKAPERGEARSRILAVALDQFSSHGFDAVSTSDIARLAGTAQSVVLYHFQTKELLWQEAMRQHFERMFEHQALDKAIHKDLDILSRLRVLLRAFVLNTARFPELGRVVTREGVGGGERLAWLLNEMAGANYRHFRELLRDAAEQGLVKTYSPDMLTIMMHGAAATLFNMSPLSEMRLGRDPFSADIIDQQADMVVDVLLNGLLTPKA